MNFIPLNGWPQLKDIPEKLEHFREVYARFAKVNRWYKSIEETEQTGNPVIFEKALKLNATALSLAMLPIQSGTGDPSPENVRPISGRTKVNLGRTGKNLLPMTVAEIKAVNTSGTWDGNIYTVANATWEILTDNDDNVLGIKVNGTTNANHGFYLCSDVNLAAGTYTLNGCPSGLTGCFIAPYDITQSSYVAPQDTGSGATGTFADACHLPIRIRIASGTALNNVIFKPMMRDASISDATFEPYMVQNITIALGQTVYGGNLDVKTGVLTITHELVTYDGSDDENWSEVEAGNNNKNMLCPAISGLDIAATISDGYCNQYKVLTGAQTWGNTVGLGIDSNGMIRVYDLDYNTEGSLSAWKTHLAATPLQLCYKLATPTTVQLTGEELEMLKGYNYISTDADSLTVKAYTI